MHSTILKILLTLQIFWTLNAHKESIIIPRGVLYFTDKDYPLNFDLDLTEYFSNVQALKENTKLMERRCKSNPNTLNCNFFYNNIKEISEQAIRETQYISSSKQKRDCGATIISLISAAIISSIVSFFTATAVNTDNKETIEQINFERENTLNNYDLNESQFLLNNFSINSIATNSQEHQEITREDRFMYQIISSTLFKINKHNKDTIRYMNALSENLASNFFTIIDIVTFENAILKLSKDIPTNINIFTLSPFEIIQLSTLQSNFINGSIKITVFLPIIQNTAYDLFNFVPIPVMRDNNTFILNTDAQFILKQNNLIQEIPTAKLTQCVKITNLTVCNSLFLENLHHIDDCTLAQIKNISTTALCVYRHLPNKCQIIRLTEESIYIHTTKPIALRISCGLKNEELDIWESKIISFHRECKIFKRIDNSTYNGTTIKIEVASAEPEFSIYDNGTWTNVKYFLDQYNIWNTNLYYEFKRAKFNYEQRSKILKIDENIFTIISNNITNLFDSISSGIIKYIILFAVIPLFSVLACILCNCRSKK